MAPIKARVRNGRLVLDEPTHLPEGTVVELVPLDAWDQLDVEDRKALHQALERSADDVSKDRIESAEDVMRKIRRAR